MRADFHFKTVPNPLYARDPKLKEFNLASENLDTAVELLPKFGNDPLHWFFRGLGKTNLGHHADAIKLLDKAIERDPDSDWYYEIRGDAKLALGKCSEAIADYDQGLALAPNYLALTDKRANATDRLTLFNEVGTSASTCVS